MEKEFCNAFIKELTIAGYKSISSDSLSQKLSLSNINVLIGANGSGKSNFLSYFKMLKAIFQGKLQNFISKEGDAEFLLHYGSKITKKIFSKILFNIKNEKYTYSFDLEKDAKDSLFFANEELNMKDEYYGTAGNKESDVFPKKIENIPKLNLFQFHDTTQSSGIRRPSLLEDNHELASDGGNLAAYLYLLKEKYPKYYERIVSKIKFAVPEFDSFVLKPQELNKDYISLNWKSSKSDYLFNAKQLSDGSIRFIALTTLLLQPDEMKPDIILIDEPELGLHPQAIDILGNMIKSASLNSQIIIATQSARLLDSFEAENIIVCEHDKFNDCSVLKKLDKTELINWLNDFSLSELWEKNVLGGQP